MLRICPSCDRDRRRGIAVLGCVGVCQRLGLMFTYRLMPPHATGTGGEGLLFGVCRGYARGGREP